jgi:signal transduction histidine kinase
MFLGITAIVILGAFSYYHAQKAFEKKTSANLESICNYRKNEIEEYFLNRISEVQEIREDSLMVLLIPESKKNPAKKEFQQISNRLKQEYRTENRRSRYSSFYHFRSNGGSTIIILDSLNHNAALSAGLLLEELRRFNINTIKDHVYFACIPKVDGKSISIIAFSALKKADANTSDFIGLEISEENINGILFNHKGILPLIENGKLFIKSQAYRIQSGNNILSIIALDTLSDINNSSRFTEAEGNSVLMKQCKLEIPGLSWTLYATVDYKASLKPMEFLYRRIFGLIVLISLIFFVFVYITSRKITRPLLQLRENVKKIGDGDYDTTVSISSSDEIGELSQSVRRMADKLKKQRSELAGERFRRLKTMFDSQELERQRLSRELHESLGQTLAAVRLKLGGIHCQDENSKQKVIELNQLTDSIINQIRFISNNLSPTVLAEFGLPTAIRHLTDELNDNYPVSIRFSSNEFPLRLPSKLRIYLFRIAEEILTNSVKNAPSEEIFISLNYSKGEITLKISNANFEFIPSHGTYPASYIRERVELLNGLIKIEASASLGSILTIIIPYSDPKK